MKRLLLAVTLATFGATALPPIQDAHAFQGKKKKKKKGKKGAEEAPPAEAAPAPAPAAEPAPAPAPAPAAEPAPPPPPPPPPPTDGASSGAAAGGAAAGAAAGGAYPTAMVKRPVVLNQGMLEARFDFDFNITAPSPGGAFDSAAMHLGADYGVMPKLNAGVDIAIPIKPDVAFGGFLANASYEVMEMLAPRLQLGVIRRSVTVVTAAGTTTASDTKFAFGVAPDVMLHLGDSFALSVWHRGGYNSFGNNLFQMIMSDPSFMNVTLDPTALIGVGENLTVGVQAGLNYASSGNFSDTSYFANVGAMYTAGSLDIGLKYVLPNLSPPAGGLADFMELLIFANFRTGG